MLLFSCLSMYLIISLLSYFRNANRLPAKMVAHVRSKTFPSNVLALQGTVVINAKKTTMAVSQTPAWMERLAPTQAMVMFAAARQGMPGQRVMSTLTSATAHHARTTGIALTKLMDINAIVSLHSREQIARQVSDWKFLVIFLKKLRSDKTDPEIWLVVRKKKIFETVSWVKRHKNL